MENTAWRFGVVANITEYHIGDDGNRYRGTKAFTPGTKVYINGKNWRSQRESISVIGLNRFGRIVVEDVPLNCLENVRTQRIYKPSVLEKMESLEEIDGWVWWKRTSADRKETERFVKDWKNNLNR